MVAKRMVEEQAKLKEQTEAEVARRVQDARKHMDTMMKEEFHKKTKEQEEEIAMLKVWCDFSCIMATVCFGLNDVVATMFFGQMVLWCHGNCVLWAK